jgi:hypothetical protein
MMKNCNLHNSGYYDTRGVIAVSLVTQRVHNDICLAQVTLHF